MTETRTTPQLDEAKAEAFADNLVQTLNHGALCLMISVGHRTGLFDAMREQPPMTSTELAKHTGLEERYVREWLGAMATGGIVTVDPATTAFQLPAEHAAFLTRPAGADNIAVFAQYISLMGGVEDDIVEVFKKGGGVPYERFPRFHEVMAEDSGQSVLSSLESSILPIVPEVVKQLESGIRVLDVGCGRGKILCKLAALYPKSRFVGLDLSREAVEAARTEAQAAGLSNVEFVERDATTLADAFEPGSFELVTTFDAVHDQAKPLEVLKGIEQVLTPDGTYLMQDIRASSHVHENLDHPFAPFLYTISCMHCMTVSLAQGGDGLGTMWGEQTTNEYLKNAGFGSVVKHELAHDIQNNWYVVHK